MPKLWERPWSHEEDEAIRDLAHWTMRGGRDRSEQRLEWSQIAQILNDYAARTANIPGESRWYTTESVKNRYHHYIRFNYETKAEWDARVTIVKAELASEKLRKLSEMVEKYGEECDHSVHKSPSLAQLARAKYEEEMAEEAAEQARARLEADKAKKADSSALNEANREYFIRDRESAVEQAKVADATKRGGKVEEGNPKPFNPFEGIPLDKNFPKTPMKFCKGEIACEAEEAAKKTGEAHEGKPKPFDPFEGVPLSPNFPKTPMNFYKGEVIVKAPKVSGRQAAKTSEEGMSTQMAPEVIVLDDEPATITEGAENDKGKKSNIEMMLNDVPCYD